MIWEMYSDSQAKIKATNAKVYAGLPPNTLRESKV